MSVLLVPISAFAAQCYLFSSESGLATFRFRPSVLAFFCCSISFPFFLGGSLFSSSCSSSSLVPLCRNTRKSSTLSAFQQELYSTCQHELAPACLKAKEELDYMVWKNSDNYDHCFVCFPFYLFIYFCGVGRGFQSRRHSKFVFARSFNTTCLSRLLKMNGNSSGSNLT